MKFNKDMKNLNTKNSSSNQKALVFGTLLGAAITKSDVLSLYNNTDSQVEAILAFDEYFNPDFLFTAMDLSVEAECFGSAIIFSEWDAPNVENRLVSDINQIKRLNLPDVGDKRSRLYLDAAKKIASPKTSKPVFGVITGPFTLAGRLYGVTEMFQLVMEDELVVKELIEKCHQFLLNYSQAFKEAGCDGIVVAEPLAGLLSPKALKIFSSAYIQSLVEELASQEFHIIYHNCGARSVHLDAIFNIEASIFHFGAPMDMISALNKSNGQHIISGNLDPSSIFHADKADAVVKATLDLLIQSRDFNNFIIAPGCELPITTPLLNVSSFYSVLRD